MRIRNIKLKMYKSIWWIVTLFSLHRKWHNNVIVSRMTNVTIVNWKLLGRSVWDCIKLIIQEQFNY